MTGPDEAFRVCPEVRGHPDRRRWNAKYSGGSGPAFRPRPVALAALARPLPAGSVLDLASGPSGIVLLAAAAGRDCVAVDASDTALGLLAAEAARRRLGGRIRLVHADLARWRPEPGRYDLVLGTGFWDAALFPAAARAVRPGGMIGWEAFTLAARGGRPTWPASWCLRPGEPASLLPAGFELLDEQDRPDGRGAAAGRRRMLARLAPAPRIWVSGRPK
ncbi:MAG: methyltransferase domain-containing protein [Streptosporangiaceae bacterium]